MRTLRGNYFIASLPEDYQEIDRSISEDSLPKRDYYVFDRSELRKKLLESGIYSSKQIEKIESEGCKKIVGNSLCISPFSGYRYYLAKRFSKQILRGLKIIMNAVAADSADIVVPSNNPGLADVFRKEVERSPNIYMRIVRDAYPLGDNRILHRRLYGLSSADYSGYFPGIEGVLVIPVEELLRLYLAVEDPQYADTKYVSVVSGEKKYFVQIGRSAAICRIIDMLNIGKHEYIIKGDPLSGKAVHDLEHETVADVSQVFAISENPIKPGKCVNCGRCMDVCPVKNRDTHSMIILRSGNKGVLPYAETAGCIGCGLCVFFCPAMKE
ncbi:MAG: 4Fe-4S binding protein [Elusimicrobia bacterium]|nr:4Fe-4S binding protein [Elusimicrobiota bacterium]